MYDIRPDDSSSAKGSKVTSIFHDIATSGDIVSRCEVFPFSIAYVYIVYIDCIYRYVWIKFACKLWFRYSY